MLVKLEKIRTSLDFLATGDCFEVHISNLHPPENERLVRELQENHVQEIKRVLRTKETCYTIFIGNIQNIEKSSIKEKRLKKKRKYVIETLGGNHTRQAIIELLEEDKEKFNHLSLVRCRLYANLPTTEALKIGYDHNIMNELSKPTGVEDLTKLFRRELLRVHSGSLKKVSAADVQIWHVNLCQILGLDSKSRDLHNRYQKLLSLARSEEVVWNKLTSTFSMYNNHKFKNQPRGSMKIFHLKRLGSLGDKERLLHLSKLQQSKDWKDMPKDLNRKTKDKPAQHIEEGGEDDEHEQIISTPTTENRRNTKDKPAQHIEEDGGDDEHGQIMSTITTENSSLKSEMLKLKKRLSAETHQCNELRTALENKESAIMLLEKQVEDQKESLQHYLFIHNEEQKKTETALKSISDKDKRINELQMTLDSKNKEIDVFKNQCASASGTFNNNKNISQTSTSISKNVQKTVAKFAKKTEMQKSAMQQNVHVEKKDSNEEKRTNIQDANEKECHSQTRKKRRLHTEDNTEENEFTKDEEVLAFWRPGKCWYNAMILEKTTDGYSVQYKEDNVVEHLLVDYIKKLSS